MKKTISLLCVIIMLTALFTPAVAQNSPAADFKLQDLNKNFVSLSDYKGKRPVILFFWTTWCPYCRVELGELSKRYAQLTKEGIEALAVDVNEPASIVEAFLKKMNLKLKVLLDSEAKAAHSYEILGVPTYVLVNKEGVIVFKGNSLPERKIKELAGK